MADDRPLGERELDVMAVLWAHGSGTVGEVQRRLGAKLAYTPLAPPNAAGAGR
jgi:predicted transcriptional regulator